MDRKHLSPTQMGTLTRCGVQYFKRYVEGKKRPPGVAMLGGRGLHSTAENNFRQKRHTWVDLPKTDIVEYAVESFGGLVEKEGVELSREESAKGKDVVVGETKDKVASIAGGYSDQMAPDYQPELIEVRMQFQIADDWDFVGIIDLVDAQERIIDFKFGFSSQSKPPDADVDLQLTAYSVAWYRERGFFPEVVFDHMKPLKAGPKRTREVRRRSEYDVDPFINRMNSFISAVEGLHNETIRPIPAAPGDWACSEKWCGYWNECDYVNRHI